MEEAKAAEDWMIRQTELLERKYDRSDFTVEEGEQFLHELDEFNDLIRKYHGILMALTDRSAQISPLWQRGERIQRPIPVTALTDYADANIIIRESTGFYFFFQTFESFAGSDTIICFILC